MTSHKSCYLITTVRVRCILINEMGMQALASIQTICLSNGNTGLWCTVLLSYTRWSYTSNRRVLFLKCAKNMFIEIAFNSCLSCVRTTMFLKRSCVIDRLWSVSSCFAVENALFASAEPTTLFVITQLQGMLSRCCMGVLRTFLSTGAEKFE